MNILPKYAAVKPICAKNIENWFNASIGQAHSVELVGGGSEPEYQPANTTHWAKIIYRDDYLASALHEIAHWSLAGTQRKQMADYGYWYTPEGRDDKQQAAFMNVEAKPQAVEWWLSRTLGVRFQVSLDNPEAHCSEHVQHFVKRVSMQAQSYAQWGLPTMVRMVIDSARAYFAFKHNNSLEAYHPSVESFSVDAYYEQSACHEGFL